MCTTGHTTGSTTASTGCSNTTSTTCRTNNSTGTTTTGNTTTRITTTTTGTRWALQLVGLDNRMLFHMYCTYIIYIHIHTYNYICIYIYNILFSGLPCYQFQFWKFLKYHLMHKHLIKNAWNKFLNGTGHPKGQSSIVDQNVHSCHPSSLNKEA